MQTLKLKLESQEKKNAEMKSTTFKLGQPWTKTSARSYYFFTQDHTTQFKVDLFLIVLRYLRES